MSRPASRFFGIALTVGLACSALLFITVMLDNAQRDAEPAAAVTAAVVCGAFYIALMRGALGRTLTRMLESSSNADAIDRSAEIDDLLAQQAQDRLHLMELEERIEFAERMLAERGGARELPLHRTPV